MDTAVATRVYDREYLSNPDLWPELAPLANAHFAELDTDGGHHARLSRATYDELEHRGALRVYTVRDDGQLVGYCSMVVQNYIHALHLVYAHEDAIYITPEARGRGSEFISWMDDRLAAEGVHQIHREVKNVRDHGPMLRRQGYEPASVTWVKRPSP